MSTRAEIEIQQLLDRNNSLLELIYERLLWVDAWLFLLVVLVSFGLLHFW